MEKLNSKSYRKNAISFLKLVKNKINEIKSDNSKEKRYSLLSIIFLCFIENKKKILDRKLILDFVKDEVINNPNKIVSTFKFKNMKRDIITENNCYMKVYQILFKSKIFNNISNNEQNDTNIELNLEFLDKRKNILYRQMFDEELHKSKKINNKKKRRKFDNSLSVIKIKTPKIDKKTLKKNELINIEIDNKNNIDVDSTIFSIKESSIKKKEDTSINNSIFIDNIKPEKKIEVIGNSIIISKSLLNLNSISQIDSNENSLVMPLFADDLFNDKERKYKFSSNEYKRQMCSNTLKEINIIINKGKDFLSILNNPQLLNLLNMDNNYKKIGFPILNLQNDNYIPSLLKFASDKYTELCKYLNFFLYYKYDDASNLIDEAFDIKLIKAKCSLLISGIITKLSQFLLEYNYFVDIIENIFKYRNNFILKEILNIINYDKDIISKDNIKYLENLLKLELDNAINYYEQMQIQDKTLDFQI